jgi:recombination protein RecR
VTQPPLLEQLMDALRTLPGVGPKTAQRMAFHLLERDRRGASNMAKVLGIALEKIGHCEQCRTLTEHDLCHICSNPARNPKLLCIVENPSDVLAIEQSAVYRGYYFILLGHISPLDGIGPEELGLDRLEHRLKKEEVEEIILATNPTVEGEVTAHYIGEMARSLGLKTSRIAHGVPFGGELEYIDSQTLSHAFEGRTQY